MELTEFLLARISEDEAAMRPIEGRRFYACDDGHVEEPAEADAWGDPPLESDDWERLPNHHNSWWPILGPARVLAECEAKRQVIKWATYARRSPDEAWESESDRAAAIYAGDNILRALAAVYADHPDCDKSWRP